MTWKHKHKSRNVCISRGVFGVVAAVIVQKKINVILLLQLSDNKLLASQKKSLYAGARVCDV